MAEGSLTLGVHHVGLTVPDIGAAREFFVAQLGFRHVGDKPDYPAVFVSDGHTMLTLWQAAEPTMALPFDRRNHIGLHHLALRVGDAAALADLHARLQSAPGVEIEFAPEPLGSGGARHLMCRIAGGIRLELIALPPA